MRERILSTVFAEECQGYLIKLYFNGELRNDVVWANPQTGWIKYIKRDEAGKSIIDEDPYASHRLLMEYACGKVEMFYEGDSIPDMMSRWYLLEEEQ